jgi:hypothetical protein
MCDYDLHGVASRPARAGKTRGLANDKLAYVTSLRVGQEPAVLQLPVDEAESQIRSLSTHPADA